MMTTLEGKHTRLEVEVIEVTSYQGDLARYDAIREAGEKYPADFYRANLHLTWATCLIATPAGKLTQDDVAKPWPPTWEDFIAMDRSVCHGWDAAVMAANPDWQVKAESVEAEKKGDGTPESEQSSAS